MAWRKLGLVFSPESELAASWMRSHAQVPTVLVEDKYFRVFFSTRDEKGKSLTAYLDLDRGDPTKVLRVGNHPVLGFGKPGTFDDDGVMPSYVLKRDGKLWMYYSGWNQRVSVPYHNSMGLAVSEDNGLSFHRMFDGPIMERTATEPYLAVTPTVLFSEGHWKMWYISGLKWVAIKEKYEPVYAIKYASSKDGIYWDRTPELCIPQQQELEAFSRPCVIYSDGKYSMWYCFRDSRDYRDGTGSYRMGFAESKDGRQWSRKDTAVEIAPSAEGWDSTMICYPYVVEANGTRYLFYNGNGFGKSGFGVAVWE